MDAAAVEAAAEAADNEGQGVVGISNSHCVVMVATVTYHSNLSLPFRESSVA